MVNSDRSRLWLRVCGVSKSASSSADEEVWSGKVGDGGKGDIGLWNEWKESTLEERLDDSFLSCGMVTGSVVVSDGVVFRVRCGGAVTARPFRKGLGRIRLLDLSIFSTVLSCQSFRVTLVSSVAALSSSSSVLPILLSSDGGAGSGSRSPKLDSVRFLVVSGPS